MCCDFEHKDPRATEFQPYIRMLPKGELWSFPIYVEAKKLRDIADLPKVDILTGEFIE